MKPICVDYFTDPLCCWCWAFEPTWRRLRWEYGDAMQIRYRLVGLYADTANYRDPLNEINNPGQVATQWLEVSHSTGTPLNPQLWELTPPKSSYPACVAVKAAEDLGATFVEAYLRRLREAAMLEAVDISQIGLLKTLARDTWLSLEPGAHADEARFATALAGEAARQALRDDMKEARYRNIGRFPSLLVWREGPRGMLLTGCRPFDSIQASFARLAPDVKPRQANKDLTGYVRHWRSVTVPEVANNFGWTTQQALQELERAGLGAAVCDAHQRPLTNPAAF